MFLWILNPVNCHGRKIEVKSPTNLVAMDIHGILFAQAISHNTFYSKAAVVAGDSLDDSVAVEELEEVGERSLGSPLQAPSTNENEAA